MCGICGKLSWTAPPERDVVERMNARLAHRGPDSGGVATLGPLVLGHRRLAIIDLSSAGAQPMTDTSGRYWVAFNGEIYNFLALRAELVRLGARFSSRTDTEVVLESYKHWGTECLGRFNGMFAFALWDAAERRLFVARDRLGKKPLFYQSLPNGGLIFASELKALRECAEVSRVISPVALGHYLSLNYTLTAEAALSGVRKLPAAHYLVAENDKPPRLECYWDLASHFRRKRRFASEGEAVEAMRELLDDAVRLRLVSDVPLGVFLSGGIDSSAVCASMCRVRAPQEVHTFSVGFAERTFSELDHARAVAALLGVHHRDQMALDAAADVLARAVYYADEPFADTSMIPTYLLAEFARQDVTVCLTGDGGDELFGGYETYAADQAHHLLRWLPAWTARSMRRAVERLWPATRDKVGLDYKIRKFLEGLPHAPGRAHYHWRTIFSDQEKLRLLREPLSTEANQDDAALHFDAFRSDVADCHYLDQAMYVDVKTWLVDDILVKVDRTTMAHGLEARAPLLDYRLVEFAASLPVEMKIRALRRKYLLKESQRGRLPDGVIDRRKAGFNSPLSHWLTTSLRSRIIDLAARADGELRRVFDSRYIDMLWHEHESGAADHSLKLFGLINLLLWADQFDARWP